MPDLVTRVQQEIRERLDELRPLVEEHERLLRAQQALSGDRGDAATASTSRTRRTRQRTRRNASQPTRRARAPRGANRDAVVAALRERPGASAGELTAASGVSAPTIYNVLRALTRGGEVETVALPTRRSGYRLRPSDNDDAPRPDKRPRRARAKKPPASNAAAPAQPPTTAAEPAPAADEKPANASEGAGDQSAKA